MASDQYGSSEGTAAAITLYNTPTTHILLQRNGALCLRIAALEADLAKEKAENARMREAFNNAPANADFATMDAFATAYDEWWETYVAPDPR